MSLSLSVMILIWTRAQLGTTGDNQRMAMSGKQLNPSISSLPLRLAALAARLPHAPHLRRRDVVAHYVHARAPAEVEAPVADERYLPAAVLRHPLHP